MLPIYDKTIMNTTVTINTFEFNYFKIGESFVRNFSESKVYTYIHDERVLFSDWSIFRFLSNLQLLNWEVEDFCKTENISWNISVL